MANDITPSNEGGQIEESRPEQRRDYRSGHIMSRVVSHPITKSFGRGGKLSKEQIGLVGVTVAFTLEEANEREHHRDSLKFLGFTWLTDRLSRSRADSITVVNGNSGPSVTESKKTTGLLGLDKWGVVATLMGVIILAASLWVTNMAAQYKGLADSRLERVHDLEGDKSRLTFQNDYLQQAVLDVQSAAMQIMATQKDEDRKALVEKIDRTVRAAITDEKKKDEKKKELAASKSANESGKPDTAPKSN